MKNGFSRAALVGSIALAAWTSSASAATVLQSGDSVDGWKVTFPVGIELSTESGSTLSLHKLATFDSSEGLDITFTQISSTASSTITLLDESIQNNTGSAFGGFQFLLMNTLAGNAADATFGQSFVSISPFTHTDFMSNDITLSGGSIASGGNASFGGGTDNLVIDANPAATGLKKVLDFKEIPVAASVPLPAAAYSGASLLIGLGLIGTVKHLRRRLA